MPEATGTLPAEGYINGSDLLLKVGGKPIVQCGF